MIIEDSSDFKLSTGRTIYANNLLIGISPDMSVTGGYDSSLDIDDTWTAAEKIELAEYMIGLWANFKALAAAEPSR